MPQLIFTNKKMENEKNLLGKALVTRSNINGGRKVIDNEGNVGVVKHYDEELHNVFVEYDNGGSGFHCLNEGCTEPMEVNGHKFENEQYDPLYYFG